MILLYSHFNSQFNMSFNRFARKFCDHARRIYTSSQFSVKQSRRLIVTAGVCTMCGAALTGNYVAESYSNKKPISRMLLAKEVSPDSTPERDDQVQRKVSSDVYQHARERRFHNFASVEVDGELFMTPQDFLESVTDEEPRPRVGMRQMSRDEIKYVLKRTPSHEKASSRLFRDIHERGIISYSEYLFLLCILTKPKAGFKIAFKMFDTDGNERVDKQEFLVLEEIFRNRSERSTAAQKESESPDPDGRRFSLSELMTIVSSERDDIQDTSLLVHFFGVEGNETLSYDDFQQFMENLQTEVLELEFLAFSRGMPTISEEDFARVLLRYTEILDEKEYFEKLRTRIPEEKGLTFEEFRSFFLFLNNLEDFAISIKMYAISGKAIGQEEFQRAVKVTTGQDLSPHLVHTLYQLFDKDGDGKLSYVEFIGAMKDRLQRGFRFYEKSSHLMKHVGWNGFKKCMKQKIKVANQ